MIFYLIGWLRTSKHSPLPVLTPNTKVSIIIAARNEEENIGNCILSLLQQDYPRELFEIIAIDDHSQDKTLSVMKSIKSAQLKILQLPVDETNSYKKAAINYGILQAFGDLIIMTDADCIAENRWLSTIVSYYEKHRPVMIAGPVALINESGWLEKWQSLDLCGMMVITAGAITNGFPNMCNGGNLAYEKKAFTDVGGFKGIDKLPGGDDVMLMMKFTKEYPRKVHFLKSKEAIVFTQPVRTFSDLIQQRLRWLSKGTAFPDWRVSAVLIFSWLFNLSIIINFFGGFFWKELWEVAGLAFVVKTFFDLLILWSGCSFFGKNKLLWNILPAQVLHILYVAILGGMSRFSKFKWKERVYP